jgi:uncharacterized protein YoxC
MASWKPKTAGPSGMQVPVWSKSFASAIRGSDQSLNPEAIKSNIQTLDNDRIQPIESLYHHHFRQTPNQINQLEAALKREEAKIIDIKDILEKLDSMLNSVSNTSSNTDEILTTRNALHDKLNERCNKQELLQKELSRVQHLKELNEEINDESDDIFNQIERERTRAFQEYESQKREDIENSKRSPVSSTTSEDSHPSNTTPEPSRTPTIFNVNASEFKPSGKSKLGEGNSNYCLSAYKVDPSTNQKVTYHQPGYLLYPIVSRPLSSVTNNLVVLPQVYIPQ